MKDAREMVAGVISYVLESKRVERKAISAIMDVLFGRIYVIDRIKAILANESADLSTFTIAKLNAVVNMGEKQFAGVSAKRACRCAPTPTKSSKRATGCFRASISGNSDGSHIPSTWTSAFRRSRS